MNVHFVIHEAFEAPGTYETWVRDRGHTATYSRVYASWSCQWAWVSMRCRAMPAIDNK
jgi:hypothetical protein